MDPSAALRLLIRFIYLWLKSADDVLVVEGALAVIQPFISTQLQTSYFAFINNLVYYFNMWHVSTGLVYISLWVEYPPKMAVPICIILCVIRPHWTMIYTATVNVGGNGSSLWIYIAAVVDVSGLWKIICHHYGHRTTMYLMMGVNCNELGASQFLKRVSNSSRPLGYWHTHKMMGYQIIIEGSRGTEYYKKIV